jgi:hypothetical protein
MNEKSAPENELLVPFESQNLPTEYKEYYLAKRQNLFASIQGFSEIFNCYMLLDRIWLREFHDAKVASDPNRMFPLTLYFNAHAKIRVCMELALSGCLAEARSILRDAIEFVAHAHHMLTDPALQLAKLTVQQIKNLARSIIARNPGWHSLHRSLSRTMRFAAGWTETREIRAQ